MLAKRVIPCLDVDEGRVVKGVKFFDHVDAGDVAECAVRYDDQGADELVFYDITASHQGRQIMIDVLRDAAERVFMPLTVGGGLQTLDDIREMLNAGADKVSINSPAVKDRNFIRRAALKFGSQCIVLGIDANRVRRDGREFWEVYVNGGRVPTGLEVVEWARRGEHEGAGEIVLNVMNADGTREGYDLEMTAAVSEAVGIPVVASGGAGCPEDMAEVVTTGHADAALAASIFHFGTYTIAEAKRVMASRGVPVRL
ncbi:MAG: imidazole glycerol phosphate synthase subunit HisF [Phycisphaerae bacterium]|nr:imidazole glycerol phosphate synthase subunit HisF [Phycisphaerae bacterium]